MRIEEIYQDDFGPFVDLMADIEMGDHYHPSNNEHRSWLNKKIARHYFCGTRFYGLYGDDDDIIGLCGLRIEKSPLGHSISELTDIGIVKEHRRKGYGAILLEHAEKLSREADVYMMYMITDAHEWWNIAFYGKAGFAPVAVLPDIHGPGLEGHIYMRKILK